MSWVAVDADEEEIISGVKPKKWSHLGYWSRQSDVVVIPKGSIKKLIGRDLTWDDEPVELKEE